MAATENLPELFGGRQDTQWRSKVSLDSAYQWKDPILIVARQDIKYPSNLLHSRRFPLTQLGTNSSAIVRKPRDLNLSMMLSLTLTSVD